MPLLDGGAENLAVAAYKKCGLTVGWPCLGLLFALACDPRHCAELQEAGAGAVASLAIRSLRSDAGWKEVLREVKVEEWQVMWAACGVLLRLAEAAAADGDEGRLEQLGIKHRAAVALVDAAVAYCDEKRVMKAVCASITKLSRATRVREVLEACVAHLSAPPARDESDSKPLADDAAAASAVDSVSGKLSAYAVLSAILEMD